MSDGYFEFSDYQGPDEPTVAQPSLSFAEPGGQQYVSQPLQSAAPVRQVRIEDMVGRSQLPANPLVRMGYVWKNDPAYRVLFVAIGVVVLSSLVCIFLLASAFSQSEPQKALGGGNTNPQKGGGGVHISTPTAVVTTVPTSVPTPTPIATPTSVPTPTPVATPTPEPTQTPVPETFTVSITDIPSNVKNNTIVPVEINTNKAGVSVHLSITYYTDGSPSSSATPSEQTDEQGNATIAWRAQVPLQPTTVIAQVTAVAQDEEGHVATSSPVTVVITP